MFIGIFLLYGFLEAREGLLSKASSSVRWPSKHLPGKKEKKKKKKKKNGRERVPH